jgi:hypothetical protein
MSKYLKNGLFSKEKRNISALNSGFYAKVALKTKRLKEKQNRGLSNAKTDRRIYG